MINKQIANTNIETIYLFIIWNKALFCKDRIVNDLRNSFDILNEFFVEWDSAHYVNNLKSLYGIKASDYNEKLRVIGKGKFYVILIKDNNPVFERENISGRNNFVNKKVFEKKWLYRNWTGGNFRIHSSLNKKETVHDLVVLFGNNYFDLINSVKPKSIVKLETKTVVGFESKKDLEDCLVSIDGAYVFKNVIFCNQKEDVLNFVNPTVLDNNHFELSINDKIEQYVIYGKNNGELPISFFDNIQSKKELVKSLVEKSEYYSRLLSDKETNKEEINRFFIEQNIKPEFVSYNGYKETKRGLLRKIKDYIKYYYLVVKNKFLINK